MTGALLRLRRDRDGVALIEFAIALPVMIVLILYGLELANYALVRQRVSQLALQVADNASRIGIQEVLHNRPITEQQIDDLFVGANLQSGSLDVADNGRIILSGLKTNATGGQWIQYQRCYGAMVWASHYGNQDDGAIGNGFAGMGPSTAKVTATSAMPVMFVEIGYTYKPLISSQWAPGTTISEIASLAVRDDRDTSQIYNDEHAPVATCT